MKHLLRIRTFLKPYLWQTLASLLMLLALTGFGLIVPRIIRSVIDDGLVSGQTGYLVRSALLLLGLGLVSAIPGLGIFVLVGGLSLGLLTDFGFFGVRLFTGSYAKRTRAKKQLTSAAQALRRAWSDRRHQSASAGSG